MVIGSGFPVVSTTSSSFRSANAASDTLAANKRLDLENKGGFVCEMGKALICERLVF